MSIRVPEISDAEAEQLQHRAEAMRVNSGADLKVYLNWLRAIRSLLTTDIQASRFMSGLMRAQVIAEVAGLDNLAKECTAVMKESAPVLNQFSTSVHVALDISSEKIAAASKLLDQVLRGMQLISDSELLSGIYEDANELYFRMGAVAATRGSTGAGVLALLGGGKSMRQDLADVLEKLAGIKAACVAAAHNSAHQSSKLN